MNITKSTEMLRNLPHFGNTVYRIHFIQETQYIWWTYGQTLTVNWNWGPIQIPTIVCTGGNRTGNEGQSQSPLQARLIWNVHLQWPILSCFLGRFYLCNYMYCEFTLEFLIPAQDGWDVQSNWPNAAFSLRPMQ